jgi:hypothetical protein
MVKSEVACARINIPKLRAKPWQAYLSARAKPYVFRKTTIRPIDALD